MFELWRGNANAWECDELGHLNVRFYLAKAVEAVEGLAERIGMREAFSPRATATLIANSIHVRFLAETLPGAPLVIEGGVVDRDDCTLTAALVMKNAATGGDVAGFRMRLDHASPRSRRVFPWPDRYEAAMQAHRVEAPAAAGPRGLSLSPPAKRPTPAEAAGLGMEATGLGRIRASDLDAFGHLRAEMLLGKVSDSVIHFSRGFPEAWAAHAAGDASAVGAALLECRIDVRRTPRAGDGWMMRSGLLEAGAKVRRLIHWIYDPQSGEPLWSVEGVACAMDLRTRTLAPADGDTLERLTAAVIPALSGR